jgi:hypothetical protein
VIDRSLSLIGQGEVRIMPPGKGCLEIRADAEVLVENIDFDCQADEQNTIEVFGGRLTLRDCDVFASSPHAYDCVKVRSNAFLAAERCNFQSTEHAAIYCERDSTLALNDCRIHFPGNVDYGLKRAGIQGSGAMGSVKNCSIVGPCNAGIEWIESEHRTIAIEGCQLENCEVGIQARHCDNVKISGNEDRKCEIRNVRFGINLVDSHASLESVVVECRDEKSKVGLQITEDSHVHCAGGRFSGMQCGILVHQSRLTAGQLEMEDNPFAGMLMDESHIEAESLQITNVENFGLAVLSTNARVDVETLEITGRVLNGQKLTSAIYATSGEVKFKSADFGNCLCGVCVDPERGIIETVGLPKKTLADLLKTSRRSDQPLPNVTGVTMNLSNCEYVWTFAGTGSADVKEIIGDTPADRRAPKLLFPDRLELDGDSDTHFSVRAKSVKN